MKALTAAVGLGALIAASSSAQALDMCFNTNQSPVQTIIVAKKYSRPTKGGCKALTGFEGNSNLNPNFPPRLVTGTVCLNSAGDTLRVAYTVHPDYLTRESMGQIDLTYPSLSEGRSSEVTASLGPMRYVPTGAFGGPCIFGAPIP